MSETPSFFARRLRQLFHSSARWDSVLLVRLLVSLQLECCVKLDDLGLTWDRLSSEWYHELFQLRSSERHLCDNAERSYERLWGECCCGRSSGWSCGVFCHCLGVGEEVRECNSALNVSRACDGVQRSLCRDLYFEQRSSHR